MSPKRDVGSDKSALPEFLDDTSDAHAAAFGFYKGFMGLKPAPKAPESKAEPHYFKIGFVLGYIAKAALVAAVGAEAASMV